MMSRNLIVAVAVFLSAGSNVAQAGPPSQLLGKSVVVNWSETRSQREDDNPEFHTVNASHTLSVYISAAGRVFSRQVNSTRAGSGAMNQAPGQGGGIYATRVPSFSGQSMTIIGETRGGARRTVVNFDNSFTSCSATTGLGFQHGQTSITISPITGQRVEMRSATVSSVSCSLQNGNVFGGG